MFMYHGLCVLYHTYIYMHVLAVLFATPEVPEFYTSYYSDMAQFRLADPDTAAYQRLFRYHIYYNDSSVKNGLSSASGAGGDGKNDYLWQRFQNAQSPSLALTTQVNNAILVWLCLLL